MERAPVVYMRFRMTDRRSVGGALGIVRTREIKTT
jgi:hypothetical protein